ncbi:MAG: DUF1638 domain-containing protein [Acidimicrobiia bacterium]
MPEPACTPAAPDRPRDRTLVIACGALVRELRAVLGQVPGSTEAVEVVYLPANLHNRPDAIPAAVAAAVAAAGTPDRIFVAYADCGTGGLLDVTLTRLGAVRLPGAHCYEFFAGPERFAALAGAEPGTFYLTDFLARNFDALVIGGLGLDRHPELRDQYFAHYTRVVLLSQTDDGAVVRMGRAAAARLGLAFDHVPVGLEPFRTAVVGARDRVGA